MGPVTLSDGHYVAYMSNGQMPLLDAFAGRYPCNRPGIEPAEGALMSDQYSDGAPDRFTLALEPQRLQGCGSGGPEPDADAAGRV